MEKTFTVIGTFYDNNQGWAGDFVATDTDDASAQAQTQVKETLAAGRGEEEAADEEDPLRIIAVLEGAPAVLELCSAE
jgi:hypothetical protein